MDFDFKFLKVFLCKVILFSLIFLMLLLFSIACKLSSEICGLEGLGSSLSIKSIVELYAIYRRVLYGFLVFDELSVDEVDGRYWFSVIAFII